MLINSTSSICRRSNFVGVSTTQTPNQNSWIMQHAAGGEHTEPPRISMQTGRNTYLKIELNELNLNDRDWNNWSDE